MFLTVLLRFSKPNFFLVLLLFFFYFHHIPYASSQGEVRLCDTLFQCGNLTAGFPFWGAARHQPCGHPSLRLLCHEKSNSTLLIISDMTYRVLQLDNSSNTLRLVRPDFLNETFCSATFTDTTLTPELFELLQDYKTLYAYYLCDPRIYYTANFKCPNMSVGSMHQKNFYRKHCHGVFNINVPMSYVPEEEALNVTNLERVLREGFEVKLKIDERTCQECQSSGGFCTYDVATPVCCKITNSSKEPKCTSMIPSASVGLSKKVKIGIGFAFGFLGVILFAGCLLCFITRRRKKLAAQYTSKGLSTTPPYSSNNTMSTTECFLCFMVRKRGTSHHPRDHNLKALVQLKQYNYAEVKKFTKSFSHMVGKGGFGIVYSGNLYDGRKVAVKILKDFKSNGEDFINEIASMSQTSHVNIVSLLGFCYEGSKRAIVYEFLENGSLDQFISSKNLLNMDVGTLYGIALGVARGLEYLHHGCKTRIVHFDIKPQNVLLDENLFPKVSDFGLAKLCAKRESILSLLDARGTIGYIAPEVFSRMYGSVSHKSDVYSYGMLVLEIIGARNKEALETTPSNSSSAYFPDWIYKDLENGEHTWKFGDEITREEKDIAKKMALVGLWCIQPCPLNRPPMNKVVEMMEGSLDALEVPPNPVIHFSAVPLLESSSLSEENSNYTETVRANIGVRFEGSILFVIEIGSKSF